MTFTFTSKKYSLITLRSTRVNSHKIASKAIGAKGSEIIETLKGKEGSKYLLGHIYVK